MAAPVISNIVLSAVRTFDADLQFTTTGEGVFAVAVLPSDADAAVVAEVLGGTNTDSVFNLIDQPSLVSAKSHHVIVSNLTPGVEYVAYVATSDEETEEDTSLDNSADFTTLSSHFNPVMNQQNTPAFLRPTI